MTNLLFYSFLFLPLISFFGFSIKKEEGEIEQKFSFLSSKIFSIISLILIFGIYRKIPFEIEILKIAPRISVEFFINQTTIKFLFLNNFLWLISLFYFRELIFFPDLKTSSEISYFDSKIINFLPLIIFFVNLLIMSNNVGSTLLFLTLSYFLFSIMTQKFILKSEDNKSKTFNLILIFELTIFCVLTIFLTFLPNEYGFLKNGSQISINSFKTSFLISLFLLFIFSPSLIFLTFFSDKNISYKNHQIFFLTIFFYGFIKLFLFIKITTEIFSLGLFSLSLTKLLNLSIEITLLIPIIFSLFKLLFSQNFLKTFTLLFTNQFYLACLIFFILFSSDKTTQINKFLMNFILINSLFFFALNNLILYLKNSENKSFDGIFYNLKITISLLIISLFAFCYIYFSGSIFEILKISYQNGLFISILALIFNSIGIFLFSYKLIFSTFVQEGVEYYESDIELAKKIDFSSKLSLTALLICVIIILNGIFA